MVRVVAVGGTLCVATLLIGCAEDKAGIEQAVAASQKAQAAATHATASAQQADAAASHAAQSAQRAAAAAEKAQAIINKSERRS
jgi:urease accessory protein UreH